MTSPYTAGGGGTHLEASIVASSFVAVLCETPFRGLPGKYAIEARTQRAGFGEPLDDLILTGVDERGTRTKLHLQVKNSLTFTESDAEWRDVLRRAWDTLSAPGFNSAAERLGVGVGTYNARVDRHYQATLSWALHSIDGDHFVERIEKEDFSHQDKRAFVQSVRNILAAHIKRALSNSELWVFLRSFLIIHFDFQAGDSSRDAANVLDRLRNALPPDHREKAGDIWNHLIQRTGKIIPTGGGTTRETLVAALAAEGLTIGPAPSFWRDIDAIDRESRRALGDIKSDIAGMRLYRAANYQEVKNALAEGRFVQITGEPGTGKSALLKDIAEECARNGAIFVLKDSRIHPRGWSAHAHVLNVNDDVSNLLREFSCSGDAILFIDGIDKISDPSVQLTVNDVLRGIAGTQALSNWRVLTTVRQENLKHLETWIDPNAITALPLRSISMTPLDDREVRVLSAQFPRLRPLLTHRGSMDVVLKRPFFLDALITIAGRDTATELPATEVELLRLWWKLGGSDRGDFSPAQHRRNVLVELANRLARSPNTPIAIKAISPEPLSELKTAGVLRDKELGHSVMFTHDIYEEWSLCELLIAEKASLIEFLQKAGEPQALIRPMQLLGAYILETSDSSDSWKKLLEETASSALRPVWQRAVLTSCVQSTQTANLLDKLSGYLIESECQRLKKLLLAMTTVEVAPNLLFLNEQLIPDLDPQERARLAHHTARPKLPTWIRFLDWLVPRIGTLSPLLIPNLLPVLTVWQRAFAGQNVRHCREIGAHSYRWLIEFEEALHPEKWDQRRKPFGVDFSYDDEGEIEGPLRSLFLMSAGDIPDLATEYVRNKANNKRRSHIWRRDIVKNCSALAQHIPSVLVDFILEAFLEHPNDRRNRRGSYHSDFDHELGITDRFQFYPASPFQLPFLALLRQHEEQGLRLVRTLCNHSVSIWRWACSEESSTTPLPIRMQFSWGKQTFWGDGQVYLWFRGYWGNNAVESALMALEQWAFERIESGANFQQVLRSVIEGNESVAVLGLGVSLCLAYPDKSLECSYPLITCPYIWQWDIARLTQDSSGMPPNEIGNWHQNRLELTGVRSLNKKPHRKRDIRSLVPYFVLCRDKGLKRKYERAIRRFPQRLPFVFEEEKADQGHVEAVRERMRLFAEQGDPKHWKVAPTEDGKHFQIWNEPPSLKKEEYQAQQKEYTQLNEYIALALWAQRTLESGKLEDRFSVEEGINNAKRLDDPPLFEYRFGPADLTQNQRAAAVSGAAFVAARYSSEATWNIEVADWCFNVFERAAATVESPDGTSVRSAILGAHPAIFASFGFSALLARGYEPDRCKIMILNLAVDALENVVAAVFKAAKFYIATQADFYWTLFDLGVRQCFVPAEAIPSFHSVTWEIDESERQLRLIERAEGLISSGTQPDLPAVPMPWIKTNELSSPQLTGTKGYTKSESQFLFNLAPKIIFNACIDQILAEPRRRGQFLALVGQLLDWTIQEVVPPFAASKRDYAGNAPYEWVFSFSSWCGKVCTHLTLAECREEILARIPTRDNELALLIMQSLIPSFMIEGLLLPKEIPEERIVIWREITQWIYNNDEWRGGKAVGHLDREFQTCAFSTLFCAAPDFSPLVCGIEAGWPHLRKFQSIIERSIREFGQHQSLYLAVTVFLKAGGIDLLPKPALTWLCDIAVAKKQDEIFWQSNGEDTVEVIKLLIEKKKAELRSEDLKSITLIIDILVDNGVRGAGFLLQELAKIGSQGSG